LARVKACRGRTRTGLRQASTERAHRMEKERSMSKIALSGLALGAAMTVGAAQAEPLTLSADQMDQVTAGGFGFVEFFADVENLYFSDKLIFFNKFANVTVSTDIDGWLADAEAGANCFGFGCTAETKTLADSNWETFEAVAYSSSIAASDFNGANDD
jgi:hypothetical protein